MAAELEVLPGKHLSHLLWAVGIWLRTPSLTRALDHRPPLRTAVAKRALDITVSSVCLVLLAPLLLMVAGAIRLSSPGPVLFRRRRIGRDGHRFELLTFRTMALGRSASGMEFQPWHVTEDLRVTTVGRVLRRTSLDELPTIFNVLRGHMSIAGSPPSPEGVDQSDVAGGARPGLTSWMALAHVGYINPAKARCRDVELATNWSLLRELRLLWATVVATLRSHG